MRAWRCDLCGWFFKEDPKVIKTFTRVEKLDEFNRVIDVDAKDTEIYEICSKCYDRFQHKFIDYIKEENTKTEQGSFNPSNRRFTPYEEIKKEPIRKEEPKLEPKYERKNMNVRNSNYKSNRCGNCKYRDSAKISGKGYACNSLHENSKLWVELAMAACDGYERND